jgi:threonylcarbamoyladenosine tRNA methylthiotransferase MtaB
MREAAASRRSAWLKSLVGTTGTVLIENQSKGHSDGFAPVRIEGSRRGDVGPARFTRVDNDQLVGAWG